MIGRRGGGRGGGWQELLCPPSWSGGDGGERSPARLSGASRGREAAGRASPRYGGSAAPSRLPPAPLGEPPPRCCLSRACPGLAPAPLRHRGAAGAPQAAPGSPQAAGLGRAPPRARSPGRAWRAEAGGCRGPGRGGEGPGRAGGSGARPPPRAASAAPLGVVPGAGRVPPAALEGAKGPPAAGEVRGAPLQPLVPLLLLHNFTRASLLALGADTEAPRWYLPALSFSKLSCSRFL